MEPVRSKITDQENKNMKAVIEKLVNHLGLTADATEAVILENTRAFLVKNGRAEGI
jgi:hypothetical protein